METVDSELERLQDLSLRMKDKARVLTAMAKGSSGSEIVRLLGKADGFVVASTFVDEAIREVQPI